MIEISLLMPKPSITRAIKYNGTKEQIEELQKLIKFNDRDYPTYVYYTPQGLFGFSDGWEGQYINNDDYLVITEFEGKWYPIEVILGEIVEANYIIVE